MVSVIADMRTLMKWTFEAFGLLVLARVYSEVFHTTTYNGVVDLSVVLIVSYMCTKSRRKLAPPAKGWSGASRKLSEAGTGSAKAPAAKPLAANRRQQVNQAIHKAARAGHRSHAQRLVAEMENAGLQPDSDTYNSLLHACARSGDVQGVEECLSKMQASGERATLYTYNILMDCFAKADDPSTAEAWMERLQSSGLKGNNVSYSTIIHAHARLGNIHKARAWFATMVKEGVEPNIVTYNSLIHAYGRAGDAAGAESILMEVLACGCTPEVTTYTAIIDACKKSSDLARAEKVMLEMHRNGVKANVVTYSAMIDVCVKSNQPEAAVRWFDSMSSAGIRPNIVSYNSLIVACSRDPARCRGLLEQMEAEGTPPDIVSFTSLATPYASKGDWESVEAVEQELQAKHIAPNDYFLYTLLVAYSKSRPRQKGRATTAFRRYVAAGVTPNKHVARALSHAVGPRCCAELLAECGSALAHHVALN